jgi:hypothetical protein
MKSVRPGAALGSFVALSEDQSTALGSFVALSEDQSTALGSFVSPPGLPTLASTAILAELGSFARFTM